MIEKDAVFLSRSDPSQLFISSLFELESEH